MNISLSAHLRNETPILVSRLPMSHNPDLCRMIIGNVGAANISVFFPSRAAVAGLRAILGDFLRSGQDINRPLTDPLLQIAQPDPKPEEVR